MINTFRYRQVVRSAQILAATLLFIWPASESARHGANVSAAAEPMPPGTSSHPSNPAKGGPNLDPAKIEGESLCVDCHRAEFVHLRGQWRDSEHGWIGYSRLLGKRAADIAEHLGIDTNQVTKDAVCIECHATPNLDLHGRMRPILGVACEACHNPAGGSDGWLNVHAVYGPPGTRREDESEEHFRHRKERSQQLGQLQTSNIYALVRRCYNCHIVGDETLITKTDHQIEDREFSDIVSKITDEKIRHNFHLDQSVNAPVSSLWTDAHWHPQRAAHMDQSIQNRKKMYYVAGVLGRAETILRLLAKVRDPSGHYAGDLGSLLDVRDLEDVLENVELSDVERADVENLMKTLEDLELEDTAGDIDGDGSLSDEEIRSLLSAADRISELGTRLCTGDGDNLQEVELP
jgi:Cytochrome c554 and c-prime